MKLNKKLLLIIFIILIVFGIIIVNLKSNNKDDKLDDKKKTTEKHTSKEKDELEGMNKTIVYNIENKIDMNIYFSTATGESVYYDAMINTFKKLYNVEIETYNIKKEGKKNLEVLRKYLGYEESFLGPNTILFVKDGVCSGYDNFIYEYDLYRYFNEKKAFKEEPYGIYIETDEEFNKVYNSSENQIVIISISDRSADKYRFIINNIAKEYNLKYNVIFYHYGGVSIGDKIIDEDLDGKINVPAILVVKEGKVLNYTDSTKEESIKKFLKKNGFIK